MKKIIMKYAPILLTIVSFLWSLSEYLFNKSLIDARISYWHWFPIFFTHVLLGFILGYLINYTYFKATREKNRYKNDMLSSEERFKIIFTTSPSAISITTSEGIYIDVNQSFEHITGYSYEELVGKKVDMILGYETRDKLIELIKENGSLINVEVEMITKSGSLITILASVKVLELGTEKYVISVFDNITEHKATQKRMNELAAIVENSSDAIFAGTLDGLILNWNSGSERMFGYTANEITGESVMLLAPPDKQKEVKEILEKAAGGETVQSLETERITKDGRTIAVSLTVTPIIIGGLIQGFSTIARDITESRKIQNEMVRLERLNLVGQMASGIGHEIRNPMTSVKGFLQLLANKEPDKKKLDYYNIMIDELDRANSIITEFLSLARDKMVSLKPMSLNVIINSLYPLLYAEAIQQDKRIIITKGDIPNIPLNEKELRQLILNLVRNGLEAMSTGGILKIGTFVKGHEVVLYVRDDGTGIHPDIIEKLGSPFVTNKDNGTGLGLAVCYSIANRHNAKIDITTGSSGTTFEIRFAMNKYNSSEDIRAG